jgi:hypothetical protein
MNTTANGEYLKTLDQSGTPPETRIGDANQARAIWQMLDQADDARSRKRALVRGLIDGNPPYRQSDLKAAGLDYKANINFRIAESYKNQAVGAFYDLYSEAPTYATIKLGRHKDKPYPPEQLETWSRQVIVHFDWLCRYEPCFDYNMQLSQDEMVTFNVGPLMFPDFLDWKPVAVLAGQLKVPERAKSDTEYWELAGVEMDYLCDELWSKIQDADAAKNMGWNVERVKQAIINASPETQKGGIHLNWEWHQQQLKNGSLYYAMTSKVVTVAHIFFREFARRGEKAGKVSHVIVIRDSADDKPDKFLFQKIGRFRNWNECLHPMYYDRGSGGFHHGCTGMGVKMYSVMDLQNRLLNNNADKAFTPKIMFKPTTSTGADNFALQQFGDYAVLTEGYDAVQMPMSGIMEESLVFNRELTNLVSSNLSQYRSNASEPVKGNPDTATKVKLDASKEASLQKTQMARYYQQLDGVYSEMYRRAASGDVTNPRAKEFQKRCKDDGIPLECLRVVEWVKASRVVGQGSEFLRQQSTEFLFGTVLPMLPEGGRTHLIDDVIASRAGQSAVDRYNPKKDASTLPDDQYAWAISQVADMKIGVPAVPTESQNPMIFASTFLEAADQAAGSLEQGADPKEVAQFLDLSGRAIAIHLQRLSQDPSRKAQVDVMEEQFKKLGQVHDQLVQMLQQQAEDSAQRQQQTQQRMSDDQMDLMLRKQKQDAELVMKQEKLDAQLAEKSAKARQGLAIKDVTAANSIRLANQKARSQSNGKK